LRSAAGDVEALDIAYRAELDRLKPLQDERDIAARVLVVRLAADAVLSIIDAKREEDAVGECRKRAKTAHKDHADALTEAGRLDKDREHAEDRLRRVAEERARAVDAGLLQSHERADIGHEREAIIAANTAAQINKNEKQVNELHAERTALDDADRQAAPREGEVAGNLRGVTQLVERAAQERSRLAADPLVLELAEAASVDLELVGSAIAERLLGRATEADAARLDLELHTIEHKRALKSLDQTGLLPPSADADAVARRLNEAGLRGAIPGTRYIADAIASDRWEHVAALRADLVGGVVLTSAEDLPRARSVLETAALAPATIVAVGAASDLTALEHTDQPTETFIVPPSPGLWDRSVGAAERAAREAKLSAYEAECSGLEQRAVGARRLANDLARHGEEYPPGWLAARRAEQATLSGELQRLESERARRDERKREIATLTKQLSEATSALRATLETTKEKLAALARLAEAEAETAELPALVERLRVEAEEWRVAAGTALAKAEIAEKEAQHAGDAASDHRAAALRIRDGMSKIHLAESISDPSPDDALALKTQTPDPSLLRSRFQALEQRLAGETTASEAAGRRKEAIKQRDLLKSSIEQNPTEVCARAEELLGLPDAIDAVGRRRAQLRVEAERTHARELQTEAYAVLKEAKEALRAIEEDIKRAKRSVQIAPDKMPRDRHQANLLGAEARQRADLLQVQHSDAEAIGDAAIRAADQAKTLANGLEHLCDALRMSLQLPDDFASPAAPAHQGSLEEATQAAKETSRRVTAAQEEQKEAENRWHSQDEAVRKLLARDEFADLSASDRLHRRLMQSSMEVLARDAGSLVGDLRASITILRADLETQERDLKLATTSLAKTVNKALSSLRQAETRSKMPATLRDWAGQPFLTISFDKPPADDLETRLRTFVVDLLKNATNRPTGTELILEALKRAVGAFSIKILKPNEGFQLLRVPVSELSTQKFSNGQRSTVATALMLMLSELRRQSRGSARTASVGTLLLDNPFGNANAGFLIEVQRTVAAAAGIQLVYTTGIADLNALRHFPNPIALSNDAARRTMRRYVREDSEFIKLLVPLEPPPGGRVTAARVVAKLEPDGDPTA
jgi:hypothetical protein